VDPVKDDQLYGIFIVPASNFPICFAYYVIGNYLDDQGYKATYYDEDNATENVYTYTYTVPTTATNLKPIYFSAASYGSKLIPSSCYTSENSLLKYTIKVYT
jgi:hypothetical protein